MCGYKKKGVWAHIHKVKLNRTRFQWSSNLTFIFVFFSVFLLLIATSEKFSSDKLSGTQTYICVIHDVYKGKKYDWCTYICMCMYCCPFSLNVCLCTYIEGLSVSMLFEQDWLGLFGVSKSECRWSIFAGEKKVKLLKKCRINTSVSDLSGACRKRLWIFAEKKKRFGRSCVPFKKAVCLISKAPSSENGWIRQGVGSWYNVCVYGLTNCSFFVHDILQNYWNPVISRKSHCLYKEFITVEIRIDWVYLI